MRELTCYGLHERLFCDGLRPDRGWGGAGAGRGGGVQWGEGVGWQHRPASHPPSAAIHPTSPALL